MERTVLAGLKKWQDSHPRKPLLIRGARQVGKTYLIRQLGRNFEDFVEINFELKPDAVKVFERDLDPKRIIRDLALLNGKSITPGKTLLFLDEIQEAPKAITSLRYFYEILPELHVIGAGSLLDFELEKIGIPVGRISSIYLYPFSFMEFLKAKSEDLLIDAILDQNSEEKVSEIVHKKILMLLGEYMTVGGMPEAINCFIQTSDIHQCLKIHRTIIDTYRQDFNKYAKRYQLKYVELLFNSIPAFLGKKFKYSKVPGEYRKRELIPSLDLLVKAGIVHKIIHSGSQGLPLAATAKPEVFKVIFLDIALSQAILGIDSGSWILEPEVNFVNKGSITEAFVGQEILAYSPSDCKSELFYWQREARSSSAEIDYIVQKDNKIIPIEVKSGSIGTLKSLTYFLKSHIGSPFGIRFSSANFSSDDQIHNYPLYSIAKLYQ